MKGYVYWCLLFCLATSSLNSLASVEQNTQVVEAEASQCYSGDLSALSGEEFVELNEESVCRRTGTSKVIKESMTIPFLIPQFPFDLFQTFVGAGLPLVLRAVGRKITKYTRIYRKEISLEEAEIDLKKRRDLMRENLPQVRSEVAVVADQLNRLSDRYQAKLDDLTTPRDLIPRVTLIDDLLSPIRFPNRVEEALALGEEEIWFKNTDGALTVGMSLGFSFVAREIFSFAHLLPFADVTMTFNNGYQLAVKKSGEKKVQVALKLRDGIQGAFALGSSSQHLEGDRIVGEMILNSGPRPFKVVDDVNEKIMDGQIIPIKWQWVHQDQSKLSASFEFDLTQELGRKGYEQAMSGNFRQVEKLMNKLENVNAITFKTSEKTEEVSRIKEQVFRIPLIYKRVRQCGSTLGNTELALNTANGVLRQGIYYTDQYCLLQRSPTLIDGLFGEENTQFNFKFYAVSADAFESQYKLDDIKLGLDVSGLILDEDTSSTELKEIGRQLGKLIKDMDFSEWENQDLFKASHIQHSRRDEQDNGSKIEMVSHGETKVLYDIKFSDDQLKKALFETSDHDKRLAIVKAFNQYVKSYQGRVQIERFKEGNPEEFDEERLKDFFDSLSGAAFFEYHILGNIFGSFTDCLHNCYSLRAMLKFFESWKEIEEKSKKITTKEDLFSLMESASSLFNQTLFSSEYLYALNLAASTVEDESNKFEYEINAIQEKFLPGGLYKIGRRNEIESRVVDIPRSKEDPEGRGFQLYSRNHLSKEAPEISIDQIEGLLSQENRIDYLSCHCFYQKEDSDEVKLFDKDVFSYSLNDIDAEKEEALEKHHMRMNQICGEAIGKEIGQDILYSGIAKNSCRVETVDITELDLDHLSASYERYQELKEQFERRVCQPGFFFRKFPNYARITLSALVSGFGWRARGGAYYTGFGTQGARIIYGVGSNILTSYISSNNFDTFWDGVMGSVSIFPGMAVGWGEYMDMGSVEQSIAHDLAGGFSRGGITTGLSSSVMGSLGYQAEELQETSRLWGLIYLGSFRAPGIRHVSESSNSTLEKLELNCQTCMGEFLTGATIGFSLSRTLLEGKNGRENLECEQ